MNRDGWDFWLAWERAVYVVLLVGKLAAPIFLPGCFMLLGIGVGVLIGILLCQ